MKRALLTIAILAGLTGCASNDYALYADTQKAIAQARAVSETARYNALAEIAKTGDSSAKVAAVLSIHMGNGNNQQTPQMVNPPKTFGDTALQWTSILLPSITQIYGINQNSRTAIKQSDNAMATSIAQSNNQAEIASSTNTAFVGIAGKIQAPQANVTTTNNTTNNTDSSNRSTTTTTNTDSSNRSTTTTTNTDSSNRSTTTNTTTDSSNRPTTTNNNSNNTGTGGP